jgi:hypothetical protein
MRNLQHYVNSLAYNKNLLAAPVVFPFSLEGVFQVKSLCILRFGLIILHYLFIIFVTASSSDSAWLVTPFD